MPIEAVMQRHEQGTGPTHEVASSIAFPEKICANYRAVAKDIFRVIAAFRVDSGFRSNSGHGRASSTPRRNETKQTCRYFVSRKNILAGPFGRDWDKTKSV